MKGNEKIITVLNSLLAVELTAINLYMVHSEMCKNWGYGKLDLAIKKQAMDEMYHAEWLIERIIFLDGAPTVSELNEISIANNVSEIIGNDLLIELTGVNNYNNAIKIAREVNDQVSVDLLSKILEIEETHVDWGEVQSSQIEQMGIENYLSTVS
jgi:bacterioferritin